MFHILNIYSPSVVKWCFWDHMDGCNILKIDSLILVGDLNLIVVSNEDRVTQCELNLLKNYFKYHFKLNHLVEILSAPLIPTWRNDRSSLDGIDKHLYRFLIHENLVEN